MVRRLLCPCRVPAVSDCEATPMRVRPHPQAMSQCATLDAMFGQCTATVPLILDASRQRGVCMSIVSDPVDQPALRCWFNMATQVIEWPGQALDRLGASTVREMLGARAMVDGAPTLSASVSTESPLDPTDPIIGR
jgi:hypothetical protein